MKHPKNEKYAKLRRPPREPASFRKEETIGARETGVIGGNGGQGCFRGREDGSPGCSGGPREGLEARHNMAV